MRRQQLGFVWDGPPTEWTSAPVDRSGVYVYLHLIRAANDPLRAGADRTRDRQWAQQPERAINRVPATEWAKRLRALLADGVPRTFNQIAVELVDKTADVAFDTTLDRALWTLVAAQEVEHTLLVPVLFRRRPVDEEQRP